MATIRRKNGKWQALIRRAGAQHVLKHLSQNLMPENRLYESNKPKIRPLQG